MRLVTSRWLSGLYGEERVRTRIRDWSCGIRPGAGLTALVGALLFLGACQNDATTSGLDAFQRYEEAVSKLVKGNFADAAVAFEDIAGTTLSPLLSQLATLRLADSLFLDGRHAEAAEVYREFQEQYASSPDVPHAVYMRGLCFLRRMPEDHWVLPPAESREMTDVESAYEAFTWVIENRPDSFYAPRSRIMLARTLERKCRHHLYVAAYYRREGNPEGVVQRLEQALAADEAEMAKGHLTAGMSCGATPDNLLWLGRTYHEMRNAAGVKRTIQAWERHKASFPSRASVGTELERMASDLAEEPPAGN